MALALAKRNAVTCFCMSQQILNLIMHIYRHSFRYVKAVIKVVMLHIITERVI
jgi:hypothetical protein